MPPIESAPAWIKLKSDDVSTGVIFKINPSIRDASKTIKVFYVLTDEHPFEPKSRQFIFSVIVEDLYDFDAGTTSNDGKRKK